MTASDTTTTTQGELEKLVSDLRGLLANKDLDAVPEIKLLRQRLADLRRAQFCQLSRVLRLRSARDF